MIVIRRAILALPGFRGLRRTIPHVTKARLPRTIRIAKEGATRFNTVADHFATAMIAGRSERVNSTLKTIEDMSTAVLAHREALVVLVAAHLTFSHRVVPPLQPSNPTSKTVFCLSSCRSMP